MRPRLVTEKPSAAPGSHRYLGAVLVEKFDYVRAWMSLQQAGKGVIVPMNQRPAGEISYATAKDMILGCIHKAPYPGVDEF